ncbi:hypothetical protein [Piscinibacter gummiphilus]|uniref:Uncharacterized protein n=1 Tax=Piscinibacter gummiphilus TaxID=946333 RepID=A0ABZ0CPJ4_9BURK|nr:hypothetical protein [Piscinibacter gummiphilus]WOB06890.1 hypothetical protein RXV79_18430 [Piscinibacter gummiphilus]
MTTEDFLRVLLAIDFPEKYWSLCDRYSSSPTTTYNGQKAEVLSAFESLGVKPRYDGRDRSYAIETEKIGEVEWGALFAKQRHGQELMISGVGPNGRVGSNFASLAYDAKRLSDPGFSRSPFSGPPPYPRPQVADSAALAGLVREFVALVHEIKAALRARAA